MKKLITIKFFLNGDQDGKLNTKEFDDTAEYEEWYEEMKNSIEVFSSSI